MQDNQLFLNANVAILSPIIDWGMVNMKLNLQDMTVVEKLQIMEALWDDLSRNVDELESPEWHGEILKKREKELQQGKDQFEDWTQAKKDIWQSVS